MSLAGLSSQWTSARSQGLTQLARLTTGKTTAERADGKAGQSQQWPRARDISKEKQDSLARARAGLRFPENVIMYPWKKCPLAGSHQMLTSFNHQFLKPLKHSSLLSLSLCLSVTLSLPPPRHFVKLCSNKTNSHLPNSHLQRCKCLLQRILLELLSDTGVSTTASHKS